MVILLYEDFFSSRNFEFHIIHTVTPYQTGTAMPPIQGVVVIPIYTYD